MSTLSKVRWLTSRPHCSRLKQHHECCATERMYGSTLPAVATVVPLKTALWFSGTRQHRVARGYRISSIAGCDSSSRYASAGSSERLEANRYPEGEGTSIVPFLSLAYFRKYSFKSRSYYLSTHLKFRRAKIFHPTNRGTTVSARRCMPTTAEDFHRWQNERSR